MAVQGRVPPVAAHNTRGQLSPIDGNRILHRAENLDTLQIYERADVTQSFSKPLQSARTYHSHQENSVGTAYND